MYYYLVLFVGSWLLGGGGWGLLLHRGLGRGGPRRNLHGDVVEQILDVVDDLVRVLFPDFRGVDRV